MKKRNEKKRRKQIVRQTHLYDWLHLAIYFGLVAFIYNSPLRLGLLKWGYGELGRLL